MNIKINQMNENGGKMKNEINDKNDDYIPMLRWYNNSEISRSNNKTTKIIETKMK